MKRILTILVAGLVLITLSGCTTAVLVAVKSRNHLSGMTQAQVERCMGKPTTVRARGNKTTMMYKYTNRGGRGHSNANRVYHCTVRLVLVNGKVKGAYYNGKSGISKVFEGECGYPKNLCKSIKFL